MEPCSAYIHVPFCRHRCGYCNFAVVARRDDLAESYLTALERELSWLRYPREVNTLFLGGGTPTHLPPAQLECLLRIARRWFPLSPGGEFSIEANPCDLTAEKIAILAQGGVTRLSIGVQSFQDAKLAFLERDHRRGVVVEALMRCRGRFESISLDLIFAVPGETLAGWRADLEAAMEQRPDHLSTYSLTLEKGAAFWARWAKGQLNPVDEESERAMYLEAIDRFTSSGWEHYEVSNFARPGHRCRHNEVYWSGGEYYAAGPGAARHVGGIREVNHRSTSSYLRRVLAGQSPVAEREQLDPESKARERLVFQLRLIDGIDLARFHDQTGFSVNRLAGSTVAELEQHGLLEHHGGQLRLTREGLLVSDSICTRLLVPCRGDQGVRTS
jgi:oxygen-independent coproporphyrinogen III oxidase